MVTSRLIPIVIETTSKRFGTNRSAWDSKVNGKPSTKAIEHYILAYADSQRPEGVNAHIAKGSYVDVPHRARIIDQRSGAVLAEWQQAAFFAF